jgi:hypothetical protein
LVGACGLFGSGRKQEAPLAHLHGKEWVRGAYELYAGSYQQLESGSQAASDDAFRVLAQKGIVALGGLQSREVPFYIKVAPDGAAFQIHREVPERLTFTADMSQAERDAATAAWHLARDHIHTDYQEIQRLQWALGRLLSSLQRVRNGIEHTYEEQLSLSHRLAALAGGGDLPFELPYEVTRQDYERILFLLLERLEDDRERLKRLEANIVAVGLTVRATDAGSASLAANTHRVLLAVVADATGRVQRPSTHPQLGTEADPLLAKGREIHVRIQKSPEYQAWVKERQEAKLRQIGSLFALLDQLTGLGTSRVYKSVLQIWSGNADYLDYLKLVAGFAPAGSQLGQILDGAIGMTQKLRSTKDRALAAFAAGQKAVAKGQEMLSHAEAGAVEFEALVLNAGSAYARQRIDKQLAFFQSRDELAGVLAAVGETDLVRGALPEIPGLGG